MRLRFFSSSITDGFLRMGKGIEQRHQRCAGWWEPHLRCSRAFIDTHTRHGTRCAVFGAGRLLDIDIAGLLGKFERVELFDADQSCLPAWRARFGEELGRRIIPRIEDLTDELGRWSTELRRGLRGEELAERLVSHRARMPSWSAENFDTIISLNVLGQIPLYWRDYVREANPSLSEEGETALCASMGELQRAHIEGLFCSPARQVIALFDSEYYFYESSESEWRTEEALFGDSASLLFSSAQSSRNAFSQDGTKLLTAAESWLWHLAPQFVEHDEEGEIHRVEARVWES